MTERELIHSQTGKYGTLIELRNSHRIGSLFVNSKPGDRYYVYKPHSQFVKFFNQAYIYVCAESEERAEDSIFDLLHGLKLV
jgi:hypothetical protein